ncbi:unnamed protein product, partial [Brugia timori]|uniref:Secreted protein n=1 Tax=Brugia timori TaxID=42155 RepID=A0A0R3Q7B7_9BILA
SLTGSERPALTCAFSSASNKFFTCSLVEWIVYSRFSKMKRPGVFHALCAFQTISFDANTLIETSVYSKGFAVSMFFPSNEIIFPDMFWSTDLDCAETGCFIVSSTSMYSDSVTFACCDFKKTSLMISLAVL